LAGANSAEMSAEMRKNPSFELGFLHSFYNENVDGGI
jgi:hypothetical protein